MRLPHNAKQLVVAEREVSFLLPSLGVPLIFGMKTMMSSPPGQDYVLARTYFCFSRFSSARAIQSAQPSLQTARPRISKYLK